MARNLPDRSPVMSARRRVRSKIAENGKELRKRDIWVRNNAVNWKDESVWAKIRNQGCYHKSDEIIVSCGTVTINKAEGPCPKVLVVYNNRIGIFQLPKGRKDIGEGYLDAAIRETTEETGIAVRPLRLRFGSRSTPPRLATATGATAYGSEDPSTGVTRSLSNEMIGVSECCLAPGNCYLHFAILTYLQYVRHGCISDPDPATGAWRNIHWYAAKPCDGVERDEACMPIADDREKFSTYWFSEIDALTRLKLDDEKFMVRVAFEYTRNMSADDWSSNEELEGK
ncbi:hypothetical protein EKO27_g11543 [Xylaria grammica]|uniref:Nudix hydrolase domain-containing protein n=1 Tax=Xylaria grammica TaxID=363999 RepID=A0A439CN22_9PEZI|nr:hypothetical protein EKO27_g11543 [Xylaria grammica]